MIKKLAVLSLGVLSWPLWAQTLATTNWHIQTYVNNTQERWQETGVTTTARTIALNECGALVAGLGPVEQKAIMLEAAKISLRALNSESDATYFICNFPNTTGGRMNYVRIVAVRR